MNPVRPNVPLVTTPRPVRPEARAAQRAFFDAAIQTPAAARAPSQAPVRPVTPTAETLREQAEAPQRYLRPGSLLDIKV